MLPAQFWGQMCNLKWLQVDNDRGPLPAPIHDRYHRSCTCHSGEIRGQIKSTQTILGLSMMSPRAGDCNCIFSQATMGFCNNYVAYFHCKGSHIPYTGYWESIACAGYINIRDWARTLSWCFVKRARDVFHGVVLDTILKAMWFLR